MRQGNGVRLQRTAVDGEGEQRRDATVRQDVTGRRSSVVLHVQQRATKEKSERECDGRERGRVHAGAAGGRRAMARPREGATERGAGPAAVLASHVPAADSGGGGVKFETEARERKLGFSLWVSLGHVFRRVVD